MILVMRRKFEWFFYQKAQMYIVWPVYYHVFLLRWPTYELIAVQGAGPSETRALFLIWERHETHFIL